MNQKIKKNDIVRIISGKDRGKEGKVMQVVIDANKLVVENLNLYKKRAKPKVQGEKGEMVLVARPLSRSNVMLVCPSCKKPARVKMDASGPQKERICKKCGVAI